MAAAVASAAPRADWTTKRRHLRSAQTSLFAPTSSNARLRSFSSSAPSSTSGVPPVVADPSSDLRALLGAHFPLEDLRFVATYGSAAFAQLSEEEAAARHAAAAGGNGAALPAAAPVSLVDEPMLDLIFGVADPVAFHRDNMRRNPAHYSFMRLAHRMPRVIGAVQEYGAGVWYNTLVRLPVPGRPGQTKLIKYGVVSTERLVRDLREWDSLYIAGRMHKPMGLLRCQDAAVREAAKENLATALRTAIILVESKQEATAATASTSSTVTTSQPVDPSPLPFVRVPSQSLFASLVSISYAGDIRMKFAEHPHKIAKIVIGNWRELVSLYRSSLRRELAPSGSDALDRLERDEAGDRQRERDQRHVLLELACDETTLARMIAQLPRHVRAALIDLTAGTVDAPVSLVVDASAADPLAAHIARLPAATRHALLTDALARIVARSSREQTIKGLLTAGVRKSVQYAWAKVQKAMRK